MIDQGLRLREYFKPPRWKSSMTAFRKSGFALVDRISALQPKFVVDAGCGYNEFKGRISNCIGIDLVNPQADLVCEFVEAPIREGSIDVVMALGSVNFGDEENVLTDLSLLASWLSPGGKLFMRGNPGELLEDSNIVVFPWSSEAVARLGTSLGLRVAEPVEEEFLVTAGGIQARRLTWTYEKPAV
jgi:hypothetical protein